MVGRSKLRPERVALGDQVDQVACSPMGWVFVTTTDGTLACLDSTGGRIWERGWTLDRFRRLALRIDADGRPWIGVGGSLI